MITRYYRGTFSAIAAITICVGTLAACETTKQVVSDKEDHLAAAGFLFKPANTPDRQAMLNRLPAHKFLRRVRGDIVSYVYADPTVCDCLYVGDQTAYGQYQAYRQSQELADQAQATADEYSDPAWNWGAWGTWGRWDPGLGFGPRFGW